MKDVDKKFLTVLSLVVVIAVSGSLMFGVLFGAWGRLIWGGCCMALGAWTGHKLGKYSARRARERV